MQLQLLDALMGDLDGHGAAVEAVLNKLRVEMSGIDNAFRIDPHFQELLLVWKSSWPPILGQT